MNAEMIEKLAARARTMLPPATVMLIECASDASGSPSLLALLEEIQQKGLRGEPLCDTPCETIILGDRVLLRCGGCKRASNLPTVAGIGRGQDKAEAYQNALYALTLPLDHPNTQRKGCVAAQQVGEGSFEDIQYACIFNRVAYTSKFWKELAQGEST